MKTCFRLTLTLTLCASLTGCRSTSSAELIEPSEIVLASVNGVSLSLEEALSTFDSSHAGHGVLINGEPAVRELTGRIVEQQLFMAEAETLGITEDPGILQAVETYRLRSAEILFWKEEVDRLAEVSEEEVQEFYDMGSMALNLSIIEHPDRARAEELRGQIEGGADFGELASSDSIHPSSSFGGTMMGVRRGSLGGELDEVSFALVEPGSLSPVVPSSDGFAFIRLDAVLTNFERPEPEVALPQIRSVLESRRREEAMDKTRAEVRERGRVKVHEELLTQSALLGDETPETVVAEAADKTLTMGELRKVLNPDALERVSPERASEAAIGVADQWAMEEATGIVLAEMDYYQKPKVVKDTGKFRKSVILGTLYRDFVYRDLMISEEGLREFYEEHKETRFRQPVEFLPAYIVLEDEETALALLARIEAGEELSALAKDFSIDTFTAAHGGEIGWINQGDMLPEVEELMAEMEIGATVGPIETSAGFFLLQLRDRKDHSVVPFERAKLAATRELTEKLQRDEKAGWAKRLRERADIQIFEDGIASAVAWLDVRAAEQAAEEAAAEAAMGDTGVAPTSGGHGERGPH